MQLRSSPQRNGGTLLVRTSEAGDAELDLERSFIERTDFSATRRGYDPEQVDKHLKEIADAVEELKRSVAESRGEATMAGAAAEQVQSIVEAAERSASGIEEAARREAAKTREDAESQASAHVQRVRDATSQLLERAKTLEASLGELIDGLRAEVEDLTRTLRDGAVSLRSELDQVRAGVGELAPQAAAEPTGPEGTGPPTSPGGPVDTEPQVAREVEATTAEAAETAEAPELQGVGGVAQPQPEPEPKSDPEPEPAAQGQGAEPGQEGNEGARLIALNMALNGTPREETARYLDENFDLQDTQAILDEVYAQVG